MACFVKLRTNDGREFELGRFNTGKKTDTEVALAAARKFKNLIGKLECGNHVLLVQRDGGNVSVPVEQFRGLV